VELADLGSSWVKGHGSCQDAVFRRGGLPLPFHELPPEVVKLLAKYTALPRLVAHLTAVHDTAITLITQLDAIWPRLE
jgi:hypothetical protein